VAAKRTGGRVSEGPVVRSAYCREARVSRPGVAGEVTVDFPNETLRGQLGRRIAALGGFSPTGVRRARASAGKARSGLRTTDAVSGKVLAFPLLHSSAVAWEQGALGGPIADRRNDRRLKVGRLPTRAGAQAHRPMKSRRIDSIILPYMEELPLTPSVAIGDKITHAVELMLSHNVSRIAVVRNLRAIGLIRLEDALQELGLEMPVK